MEADRRKPSLVHERRDDLNRFLDQLTFRQEKTDVIVQWHNAAVPDQIEEMSFSLADIDFYVRGDSQRYRERQADMGILGINDPIAGKNQVYFEKALDRILTAAGLDLGELRGDVS